MILEKHTICTVFGKPYIYNELQKTLLNGSNGSKKPSKKNQKHKVTQYDQSITSGFKFWTQTN